MPELAQEAIGTNDFEKWLNGRNRWLQTAAKQLIDNKRLPSAVELTELVRLCKLEAAKQNDSGFLKVAHGAFSAALLHRVVRVEELSQVFGVNAIKPGASLPFGAGNLAVIYGQNGSGKSSFSRLLKQLCGSRSRDEIRPNVFSSEEHTCSAQCRITIDGNPVVSIGSRVLSHIQCSSMPKYLTRKLRLNIWGVLNQASNRAACVLSLCSFRYQEWFLIMYIMNH